MLRPYKSDFLFASFAFFAANSLIFFGCGFATLGSLWLISSPHFSQRLVNPLRL